MSLIARATPTLLEGKFEVSDPLNTVRTQSFHLYDFGFLLPVLFALLWAMPCILG